MTASVDPIPDAVSKPRVALMGEFSAGKSTLANLLLEQPVSPVRVTATQLPPVWYRAGPPSAVQVSEGGDRLPMPYEEWMQHAAPGAQLIELSLEADVLGSIDLIDMPGTSDPNLLRDYWKTIVPLVDMVIWCTPANQAWRQSEAAIWEELDEDIRARSLLLVTRIDKIRSEVDRGRLMTRLTHEAGDTFSRVLPISLTEALSSPSDEEVLEASGAAEMIRFLIGALEGLERRDRPDFVADRMESEISDTLGASLRSVDPVSTGKIVPRRVTRAPAPIMSGQKRPLRKRPVV